MMVTLVLYLYFLKHCALSILSLKHLDVRVHDRINCRVFRPQKYAVFYSFSFFRFCSQMLRYR